MQFIKKTWHRMVNTIIILILLIWVLSVLLAWQNGSIRGYELGKLHADMTNPLKAKVESEKPFCYDKGIIYDVRKGKKVFIPEF